MQPTVVYILSTNYAGSHFLSLLLGSHSKALHIGEINHLRKRIDRGSCHSCGGLEQCPILGNIPFDQVDRVYDIIFSRVGLEVGILVDNSKRIPWAERFVAARTYAKKYIHLIRDPRALARRWMLYYTSRPGRMKQRWQAIRAFPRLTPQLLTGSQIAIYTYRWLAENQRITRFIDRHNLEAMVITYEDLARNQAECVRMTTEWLHLEYEPAQLDYWDHQHHGTQKQDYEWIKDRKVHYCDLRWKTFLSDRDAEYIQMNRHVQEYLLSLGLHMTTDGLTQIDATEKNLARTFLRVR